MTRYRAVIDVNVVVSGLISTAGAPGQILQAMQRGEVTIIVSPAYLTELHDVLHRPKFRRWFSVAVASRAVVEIRREGEPHPDPLAAAVTSDLTRDPATTTSPGWRGPPGLTASSPVTAT